MPAGGPAPAGKNVDDEGYTIMAYPAPARACAIALSFIKTGLVVTLVFVSSYCTHNSKDTKNLGLSPDEAYLVDACVRIAAARDLRTVTYAKSESLFAELDSTLDTTRIANTIRALNADPDRWILVFRSIEEATGPNAEPPVPSKEPR